MAAGTDGLIEALALDLQPVRRLRPPFIRAAVWIGVVLASGAALASFADMAGVRARLAALPDLRWATIGAAATAAAAGIAAFQASVPGRATSWLLLPVPGLVLWIAGSGMGCLRPWGMPGLHATTVHEGMQCITFIAAVSIPLSALLLVMLRRAKPLRPDRVATMAGLAAAAAAAALLTLFHPHDASAVDLVMHSAAVLMVIAANRLWSGRLLGTVASSP